MVWVEGGIGVRLNERRKTFFLRVDAVPEKRKRENSIYDDDLPFQRAILTICIFPGHPSNVYVYYLPAV